MILNIEIIALELQWRHLKIDCVENVYITTDWKVPHAKSGSEIDFTAEKFLDHPKEYMEF